MSAPACAYPAHRVFDWPADGERKVCGRCHPPVAPGPRCLVRAAEAREAIRAAIRTGAADLAPISNEVGEIHFELRAGHLAAATRLAEQITGRLRSAASEAPEGAARHLDRAVASLEVIAG